MTTAFFFPPGNPAGSSLGEQPACCAAERDPDFGANAAKQLDKRKKVIVYCGRGGTIKTGFGNERSGKFFKDDPERAFGIETRSLKGCYELLEVRRSACMHAC